MCLESYYADKAPKLLHFEWMGASHIFRYALIEIIPVNDINPATRRKQGEGTEEEIMTEYLRKVNESKESSQNS